ncbi:SLBB domain-containing protein [uncultured Polaribacter sp.]|uniref:SLBB domain-containing protein n=1 Tax=uncultured Polaribacter sp. TaxID=174711 RepID=UPI0026152377|nr:SLBB domain-containing protein [uncultured Polaribacter sp.]
MFKTNKKVKIFFFFTFLTSLVLAQDLSSIKNVDVNALSDDQIASYWSSMQKNGYSLNQLEAVGKLQGIPSDKISQFKQRVKNLSTIKSVENKVLKQQSVKDAATEPYGLKDGQVIKKNSTGSNIFGYDFFNNSKISFEPSVNIAVPQNYQIGPGDEIMVDLWGASEVTYRATVNKRGSIKIAGIGFIYINGFSLDDASKKIVSKLKKKHAGIGVSRNNYNKIYTNVTVSKIRTVQVNIIGEVKVPGTYSLNSLSTVLNALYKSGGPTKLGTFRNIKLIRKDKVVAVLDIYNYLLYGTQKNNLKLQDQDVLLVEPYNNLISVEGAVKRPGIYELKDNQTLSDLVLYFGGFTPKAYTDLLVLERLNGSQKEIKEVAFDNLNNFLVKAGDKLIVQESLDIFKNKITIEGEVYRPGNFELLENMTLKQLLSKSEGVTPEAFLPRGLLVRTIDNTAKENISFSIENILTGKTTILLKPNDQIKIFNKKELREKRQISISGAVNKPGNLEYVDKLEIEDVIALSGGLKEGADPNVISISRRLKDGSFSTLSDVFTISSDTNLAINNGEPFYLEPYDQINVRYLKGYTKQKKVTVSGQVNYSGGYVLKDKNERISDLVNRAGGLTDYAYVKGATLFRLVGRTAIQDLIYNVDDEDVSIDKLKQFSNSKTTSIGIDLEAILKKPGSDIDLVLEEGDRLLIPEIKPTVQVSGEVLVPSLVQFTKNSKLKHYVNNSGGFTNAAKKSKVFVRYSNGEIKTVKKFLFFKFYPKLEPGAGIFVPTKVENKNKLSTQEILGITTSLATLGLLIQALTN